MTLRPWLALGLAAALLSPAAVAAPAADVPGLRRFALIAGVDDGGKDRARLRYATTDARSMARVLDAMGGVAPADRLLLEDPSAAGLREALAKVGALSQQARATASRVELIFYYSGHSDDEGLLLQGDRLPYGELRSRLEAIPSDVRIVILDSCASGAFTRRKGGVLRPPFMIDASSRVSGQAILTSSSADEASQESDRIGGSFFTHNLISGLRGAADVTRDGRVTLNEAYQFAFQETLARTENTQGGAQHPAYAIELAGTGDVVMTDLHALRAGLVLPVALDGRIYVRDGAGHLVVELEKRPGVPVELGLEAGTYGVMLDRAGARARGVVVLSDGRRTELNPDDLQSLPGEPTVSRGGAIGDSNVVPVTLDILPGIGTGGMLTRNTESYFAFGLLASHSGKVSGGALGLGGTWIDDDLRGVQLSGAFNFTGGRSVGMQLTGGVNLTGLALRGLQLSGAGNAAGEVVGTQASGGVNVARQGVSGLQLTGVLNSGQKIDGAQIAGGANLSKALIGFQLAGGANVAVGDVYGFQIAGANIATGDLLGFQTGGANVVTAAVRGLQLGGANVATGTVVGAQVGPLDYASGLRGLQLGVVNVGGDVVGAQIGVINIARKVTGSQVGVLNLSDELYGAPIGVLNIVRQGQFHVEAWGSETSALNVGVKFGSKRIYTLLGVGRALGINGWETQVGLGGRIPAGPLYVDVDLVGSGLSYQRLWSTTDLLGRLRASVGYTVFPKVTVFAGLSANAYFPFSGQDRAPEPGFLPSWEVGSRGGANPVARFYPGFFAGLSFL